VPAFGWADFQLVHKPPALHGSTATSWLAAAACLHSPQAQHPATWLLPCLLQYPEEEREEYGKKSSHLRGRDAWLVDRVTREFLAAYAQARLRAAGLLVTRL